MKALSAWFSKYNLIVGIFLSYILPPVGILILLLTGSHFLHKQVRDGVKLKFTPGLFLLICMFTASIGAAFTLHNYSFFLVSAGLVAYFGLYLKVTKNSRHQTFAAFKVLTIFAGLYYYALYPFQDYLKEHSLFSMLTGTALIGPAGLQHSSRLIGAAYNPNFSVTVLLLALSFLLAACLQSLKKHAYLKAGLQGAGTLLLVHGIYLTGSRAGFAIMLAVIALFLFRYSRWMTIMLAVLFSVNVPYLIKLMPRNASLMQSAEGRQEIWKHSIFLWQEHSLFGLTPIGFHQEYVFTFHEKVPHAHNVLIAMFTEYGALGGTAFIIVVLINLAKLFSLLWIKQARKKQLDVFLLSLPIVLLTGTFDYVLYSPQVAMSVIFLLAYWDKYTANIQIINPRLLSFLQTALQSTKPRTTRSKKQSNNSL